MHFVKFAYEFIIYFCYVFVLIFVDGIIDNSKAAISLKNSYLLLQPTRYQMNISIDREVLELWVTGFFISLHCLNSVELSWLFKLVLHYLAGFNTVSTSPILFPMP